DQRQRVEARIERIWRHIVHAQGLIGGKDGIVGSVNNTFVERGENFRAGQGDGCGASLGEDLEYHAFGSAQLYPLQIVDGANRNAGNQRLRLGGGSADEVYTIRLDQFGV